MSRRNMDLKYIPHISQDIVEGIQLEEYLQMTDTMSSSVDRILSKGELVIDVLKKQSLMQL